MKPEDRFPELTDFELELEGNSGSWSTFRADEDERARIALNTPNAVLHMLAGGYSTVEENGVRTRCRLTPKAWLKHPPQPGDSSAPHG